jgi:hypothetical protein
MDRNQLQALRDIYVVYKSIEVEDYLHPDSLDGTTRLDGGGVLTLVWEYLTQYAQLFRERRLRNALISSCTVSLAQQLCGSMFISTELGGVLKSTNPSLRAVNVMAFYSGIPIPYPPQLFQLTRYRYTVPRGRSTQAACHVI